MTRAIGIVIVIILAAGCDSTNANTQPDSTADGTDVPTDTTLDTGDDTDLDVPDAEEGCLPEECNYVDDDCDTIIDEGFELDSDPANCGACGFVCSNAHADPICADGLCMIGGCHDGFHDVNGNPYDGCEYECTRTAVSESDADGTCADGIDNDCDGRIDGDDLDCSSCVPEYCNGLDDDCDTLTDEDFDLRSDPLNCGACFNICPARPHASPTCILGSCNIECEAGWENIDGDDANGCEAECIPEADPNEYDCDGRDDDCDGTVDEDYIPYICGSGACEADSVCVGGAEVCEPLDPLSDTDLLCDGVDNDCDGSVDEEYIPVFCYGACAPTAECIGGEEICGPVSEALDVTCDLIDGDCDNEVDEDYIPYTCGVGACTNTSDCIGGSEDCTPLTPPSILDTVCDSIDEDCNGTADEDYVPWPCGDGVCVRDSVCTAGVESCTEGPTTGDDTDCDSVDEDCDGTADEHYLATYSCGMGVCQRDSTCSGGSEGCTAGSSTGGDTNCNGLDEDCDGSSDEHYIPYNCGTGACERDSSCSGGTESCTAGPPTGSDTDCDGIDDNCDGSIDEAYASYTCGTGGCARNSTCSAGYEDCDPGSPTSESCNGIDDDCDGTTDDGTGIALCGDLAHASEACSGGSCIITGCSTGWYNIDGTVSNGCECGIDSREPNATCGAAYDLGTFADNPARALTVTANLVPAGDVDWYRIYASDDSDTTGDEFEFEVAFTSNPGGALRFDVYRGSCSSVHCSAISDCFNWMTDSRWWNSSLGEYVGENPCYTGTSTPTSRNYCNNSSSVYYIRVYRATGTTTCTNYSLRISNNSPSGASGCL